jgi:hypothetical protein
MIGLHDDRHALGPDRVPDRLRDLLREPLLHLEATREHLHQTGGLGQPHDLPVGDVGDVRLAEERE